MLKLLKIDHLKKGERQQVIESGLLALLICLSIASYVYFSSDGSHLLYGDALSRLNIARKVFDNLTPGLAQVGNVWLPLPQILMAPLTLNTYMWHSGLAGGIMSGLFYILGGYFIFKSARLLTNSYFAAWMSAALFALNINVLYLQTTAMSELAFLGLASALTYLLLMWTKTHSLRYLLFSALTITLITLTRYEGLALLVSSLTLVFAYNFITHNKYKKAEGDLILFGTLACLGFALWTIYLAAIFGDPLYWKHYYVGASNPTPTAGAKKFTQGISLINAMWNYLTATVWMNGLIPVIFALVGLFIGIGKMIIQKTYFHLPVFLHLSIYAFLVFTLTRNTPINQPALTINAIMDPATNHFLEFNLRYGVLMLPIIAVASSYLFAIKNIFLRILLIGIFCLQLFTYFNPRFTLMYQLPITMHENITRNYPRDLAAIEWLKQNYDGGLILISAAKHDPKMFNLGINYKNFIHEGTQKYWTASLLYPPKYAKWIVYDYYGQGTSDAVYRNLKNSEYVSINYDAVYDKEGIKIYKIKTRPDIIIDTN